MTTTDQAAALLADARRNGRAGPRLPEHLRPAGLDAALAIQRAVLARLGETAAGYKCALPGPDKWAIAPIHAGDCHRAGRAAVWPQRGHARVEPEFAFVLGQALPARPQPYAPAEVDAAIGEVRLALELIGCRYAAPAEAAFPELLADGLFNQGLLLGPAIAAAALDAPFTLTLAHGDAAPAVYEARHPDGDPRRPLHWLAEFLRSRGEGLAAGQAIITGSLAGVIEVPLETALRFGFGAHGQLDAWLSGGAVYDET
ncbi:hypothetical protein [Chitinimonas koreensis]|uniref:hypothetical protein n=1 Tax=Chitinimonas koreensis TaxID=356302 RepID=UPI0004091F01|nr:hypothetical protein [Chitinimonas koreensis]